MMRASSKSVLCVCGLAAEARIARAAGFPAVIATGGRERATALIEAGAAQAGCLVSFGIAGALAPELRAGDAVISTEVVSAPGGWQAEPDFRRHLAKLARRLGAVEGAVLGSRRILTTRAEKRRAWEETGALAVDLESDVVARAASTAGIPFLVLRTIADTHDRDLPPAALLPLSAEGTPRLGPVIASILRQPRQVSSLLALARETRIALAALREPAHALQELFAGG